ncbi:hypothetical protein OS123_04525 [Corynebacterium sp. P5875]|uniref:Late embryogenesis abundant protein n=1 Tax=Corynebacterium antarcticum TaxID=2800405 RepID=A0A9Q4CBL2_9CORY|nr:hypothetical protein [Corynebacterium antarcticum]MCX7537809.1 hypothetical protein [Corynebacterium antarcticum]
MNPSTIRMAYKLGRQALGTARDYRDRHAADSYDDLVARANDYAEHRKAVSQLRDELAEKAGSLTEESQAQASALLREARHRLEQLRKQAEEKGTDLAQDLEKQGGRKVRKVRKAAEKARKKAERKINRRKCLTSRCGGDEGRGRLANLTLLALLVSTVAGVIYWLRNRADKPGTTPPDVRDHAAGSSGSKTEAVADKAASAAAAATAAAGEKLAEARAKADELLDNAGDGSVVDTVADKAEDIAESVHDNADEIAGEVTDKAEDIAEKTRDGVEDAADAVETLADDAETVAGAVADDAADAAKAAADEVGKAAEEKKSGN